MPDDERWEGAGLAALTGRPDGPPLPAPSGLVAALDAVAAPLGVDPLPLLAERARIAGFRRRGLTSCGGGTRLLRAADGWLALTLARPEDEVALPAWLEVDVPAPSADPWDLAATAVAGRPTDELVARAELLGLPVAGLDEVVPPAVRHIALGVAAARSLEGAVVVDLSSLWAGPLCGRLLAERGAAVTKVESARRPDGARFGPAAFYERQNGQKRVVEVDDLASALPALVAAADVVIEASRPRALAQHGIVPERFERPQVWIAITGWGRASNRVAFGDDAAVGGGLVAWEGDEPRFCADAIADPITGITAAAAAIAALAAGGRWLLDVSMAGCAAAVRPPRPSP